MSMAVNFEEGDPVSSTNDPAVAYMKTKKPAQENKAMIVDADMQTPLALQIRAPKAVTKKKEMDKDDEEDDGLVIECDGG